MPYVKPESRERIRDNAGTFSLGNAGELNYAITQLLLLEEPKSYEDYNRLVGVLECCKLEFYRRAVAAYEDQKIKENGDVY